MSQKNQNLPQPLKKLEAQTIIIFGLGKEGWSTYSFLRKKLPENVIVLIDQKSPAKLGQNWQRAVDQDQKTLFFKDPFKESVESDPSVKDKFNLPELKTALKELRKIIGDKAILFKTPGIPRSHPFIKLLLESGVKLSSNTQLFFELAEEIQKTQKKEVTTIGVTGTKGKSTTTSVIHHLLKESGLQSFLGGNIGQPALEIFQTWEKNGQDTPTWFVLELSSHQLAELDHSPNIAVIQTITSEHLDYYPNFESYFQAKTQIIRQQTATDWVLFNQDDPLATKLAKAAPGEKTGYSLKNEKLVKLAQNSPLLGQHNLYNVIPAILISRHYQLSQSEIIEALKTFKPLPHRLQLIAEVAGVKYYDDSIATNPKATIAALKTFANQPIILIAGGYDRGQDFSKLAKEIKQGPVKALALFPPTGQRLLTELKTLDLDQQIQDKIKQCSSMKEAVLYAHQEAVPGDIVLLSPGAASFGLFANYRERGDLFKKEINSIEK